MIQYFNAEVKIKEIAELEVRTPPMVLLELENIGAEKVFDKTVTLHVPKESFGYKGNVTDLKGKILRLILED